MNLDGWEQLALIIGGLITAAGGAQGLRALFRRRPRPSNADAAVALSAGTIRWAERLEATADRAMQRAEAAENRADETDRRADEADRQMARVRDQLAQVSAYLTTLLRAIHDPRGTPEQRLERIEQVASRPPELVQEGER